MANKDLPVPKNKLVSASRAARGRAYLRNIVEPAVKKIQEKVPQPGLELVVPPKVHREPSAGEYVAKKGEVILRRPERNAGVEAAKRYLAGEKPHKGSQYGRYLVRSEGSPPPPRAIVDTPQKRSAAVFFEKNQGMFSDPPTNLSKDLPGLRGQVAATRYLSTAGRFGRRVLRRMVRRRFGV